LNKKWEIYEHWKQEGVEKKKWEEKCVLTLGKTYFSSCSSIITPLPQQIGEFKLVLPWRFKSFKMNNRWKIY
jgi:hypothetical protein